MSAYTETLSIQVSLTSHGDALIHGTVPGFLVTGVYVKHRLFAWHEPSFYGTELEIEKVRDMEFVVLPSEHVIPFFGERRLLEHLEWTWENDAATLIALAPILAACLKERKFAPSFDAYRSGKLQWIWDEAQLDAEAVGLLRQHGLLAEAGESAGAGGESEDDAFFAGLRAAFSGAVFARYYGTEETAADLRRDFPMLFAKDRASAVAGMDAQAWLVAAGWKADTSPFRPLLQLLEPEEGEEDWQLALVLQDKREPSLLVPLRLTRDGSALGSWPTSWTPHVRERSSAWLTHLQASLPAERLAGGDDDVLNCPLTDDAAWQFLTEGSQRLLAAGWQVLLPAWWEAASRKKPRLRAKVRPGAGGDRTSGGGSLFGLDSLVDFDWRIAIGDTDLTEAEFAELVARGERLVRFRGRWVPLDPVLLAQIRKAMASVDRSSGLSFQDIMQLHLLGNGADGAGDGSADRDGAGGEADPGRIHLEVELNEHLTKLMAQLTQQTEWPSVPVPADLQAELRSYQRDGFAWLAFLRRFGLGACLADDMGLGKTVQFITYLLHVKELAEHGDGGSAGAVPSLLICPTSVLGNWQKELKRFAPSLRIMLHYGSRRQSGEAFLAEAKEADLVLTSFATAALDQDTISGLHWSAICLDEAQNIKNAGTKQSVAVRSFPARHRIALTGTPIENRLSELWSIYDFINPGYLGSSRAFNEQFSQAIEKARDEERTQDLQKLVKPFMLRRKKKDPAIQLDLPDKNEMKTYINLTAEQGALYDQTVNQLMEKMQSLEGIERKGAILAALTQLKQLCDHPMLLTKEPIPEPDDDGLLATEPLIGRSAKFERLLAMVRELREEGERCLIFTQYIGMGQMLQQVLGQELQEPVLYLHGGTSKTGRDRMIEQFQSQTLPAAEQPNVFVLSIKAGGVGLNLTAANHVFHFDRWWNPAVENQATDRAYRMGQTRDVQVHKFISLGTLEERIDEMLESKQQLSDNVITSSEGWITELSTDALKDLFTLRRDWMVG
ncbi:DEAD/DEAH box helicase [Paenibacillus sp. BC26]|uniref:DEAD/DEAH box helicase n=1 Tax=Paenibacillus sp. BC26 TaxID=1881032 RepID=UPI0008E1267A|nr:DEAD/DEAH box helicase [Paenibacillus sp. BC26]SFT21585.1 Superfamily II DNA or RNA helicase, SNF2 family [Paenibacillus sp. BC26]